MKQNIYPNAAFREGDIAEKMEKKKRQPMDTQPEVGFSRKI